MHCGINAQYLAAAAQIALPHQRRILRSAGAKCFAFESQKCVEYGATEGPNSGTGAESVRCRHRIRHRSGRNFNPPQRRRHPSHAEDLAPVAQKTFMQRHRMSCRGVRNTLWQWRRIARSNVVQYLGMAAQNTLKRRHMMLCWCVPF